MFISLTFFIVNVCTKLVSTKLYPFQRHGGDPRDCETKNESCNLFLILGPSLYFCHPLASTSLSVG